VRACAKSKLWRVTQVVLWQIECQCSRYRVVLRVMLQQCLHDEVGS
jgi:hypothetical protein